MCRLLGEPNEVGKKSEKVDGSKCFEAETASYTNGL